MKEYQNALSDMSNEAMEYVRGIPVVKTFGQTVFAFLIAGGILFTRGGVTDANRKLCRSGDRVK